MMQLQHTCRHPLICTYLSFVADLRTKQPGLYSRMYARQLQRPAPRGAPPPGRGLQRLALAGTSGSGGLQPRTQLGQSRGGVGSSPSPAGASGSGAPFAARAATGGDAHASGDDAASPRSGSVPTGSGSDADSEANPGVEQPTQWSPARMASLVNQRVAFCVRLGNNEVALPDMLICPMRLGVLPVKVRWCVAACACWAVLVVARGVLMLCVPGRVLVA
jgi:hypothetical protein